MNQEVYSEWIKLFSEDFVKVWQSERKELQKVSLLLYAFQKEINKVQTKVEREVSNLKQQLQYKDNLEEKNKAVATEVIYKRPTIRNKENVEKIEKKSKAIPNLPLTEKQIEKESPDLFRDIDFHAHCSSTDISVIDLSVSDDDITRIDGSPTIKRRRRRNKIITNDSTCTTIKETDEKYVISNVKTNLFKTNVAKLDHDFSVIETTPEVNTKRLKPLRKVGDLESKKKAKGRKSNNSTLTQMFAGSFKKSNVGKTEGDIDSDETYFDDNTDKSKMGITELLQFINTSDTKKQEVNRFTNPRFKGDSISEDIDTSSQDIDQFSKGAIFDEEDIETEDPIRKNIEPEPVVRGHARKQLKGWACQQCKNFYGQMNLSPEEMQKKMDECSRHRFKYHPPDETIPGFWDLSIPPEN